MLQVKKCLSKPPLIHTGWELASSCLHLEKPTKRLEDLWEDRGSLVGVKPVINLL